MPLQHVFGTVTAGAQVPGSWLDDNFNAVGLLGAIPCSASGSNALLLTPLTNTPPVLSYANYTLFTWVQPSGSTGLVTINVNSLGALPLYDITGTAQMGNTSLLAGAIYIAAFNQAFNGGGGGFGLISLGAGGLVNIQYFTTAGTSSYTPTAGATRYVSEVVGGGAGGGGVALTAAGQSNASGGGAGGTYTRKSGLISAISGATITVGAKGLGGVAGNNNGSDGNPSSIGAVVTAPGGHGGTGGAALTPPQSASPGGNDGGAGTGDLSIPGGCGGSGITIAAGVILPGFGGMSVLGGSVRAPVVNTAGRNGTGIGSGGSGCGNGASQGAGLAGGNGADGGVIIWEYR